MGDVDRGGKTGVEISLFLYPYTIIELKRHRRAIFSRKLDLVIVYHQKQSVLLKNI